MSGASFRGKSFSIYFLFFSITSVFCFPAHASSSRSINDSLVQGLSCQNLSVDSIYRALRPDAFDPSRDMPLKNWPFRSGLTMIAGCWGLASSQRMIYYLARYNTSSQQSMPERVPQVLDMIRGEGVRYSSANNDPSGGPGFRGVPLKNYNVFAVEESTLSQSRLWQALTVGYVQSFPEGFTLKRNVRTDIEANQVHHFFRAENVGMGLGTSARSVRANRATLAHLQRNLEGRRLEKF